MLMINFLIIAYMIVCNPIFHIELYYSSGTRGKLGSTQVI